MRPASIFAHAAVGQTFNSGIVDLNYLQAFFLEQSRDDFAAIQRIVDANARANGWLIFATHDVSDSPTRFGCTPAFFQRTVEYVVRSGVTVLPVGSAWQSAVDLARRGQFKSHYSV